MKVVDIMNKIKRNSSIELLRIISMIMIIMSHYCYHGVINGDSLSLSFNKIILQLGFLGNLGVNIFFLISSYFMYDKEIDIRRIIKLLFQIFSYSIIIYLIFVLIGQEPFNIVNFIKSFFPVLFKNYWFASVYVIIYILSPYINILIRNLDEKQHRNIIIIFIFIWSILFTFLKIDLYSNYFTDILILYFIATYIKKYNSKISNNIVKLLTFLSTLGLISLTIILNFIPPLESYIPHIYSRNSLFIIMISTGMFISFLNKNWYSNIINIISSCVFGVYLLHDNYLIRKVLWNFVDNSKYITSPYLIIHMLIVTIIIFILCIIIEFIRKNTIQKIVDKYVDKYITKLNYKSK